VTGSKEIDEGQYFINHCTRRNAVQEDLYPHQSHPHTEPEDPFNQVA
jgi:hypothetical protein